MFGIVGLLLTIAVILGTYALGKQLAGRCVYIVTERRLKYFRMDCIASGCNNHFYVLRKYVREDLPEELKEEVDKRSVLP